MGNLITIEIFGQPYTFETESDKAIAEIVADSLLQEIARIQQNNSGQSGEMAKLTVMILAALNIAKDNYELKTKYAELTHELAERSAMLLQRINVDYAKKA